MLAYFEKEKNYDIVAEILKKSIDYEAEIFMSFINWGEVYYISSGKRERKSRTLSFNNFSISNYSR